MQPAVTKSFLEMGFKLLLLLQQCLTKELIQLYFQIQQQRQLKYVETQFSGTFLQPPVLLFFLYFGFGWP